MKVLCGERKQNEDQRKYTKKKKKKKKKKKISTLFLSMTLIQICITKRERENKIILVVFQVEFLWIKWFIYILKHVWAIINIFFNQNIFP